MSKVDDLFNEDEEDTPADQLQLLQDQLETAARMGMELLEAAEESETRAHSALEERNEVLNFCEELRSELKLLKSDSSRLKAKNRLLAECLDDLENDHASQREQLLRTSSNLDKANESMLLLQEAKNEADFEKELTREKQAAVQWKLAIKTRNQKSASEYEEKSEECRKLKSQLAEFEGNNIESTQQQKSLQQQLNAALYTIQQQKMQISSLETGERKQRAAKNRQRRQSLQTSYTEKKRGHRGSVVALSTSKSFAKLLAMQKVSPVALNKKLSSVGEDPEEDDERNEEDQADEDVSTYNQDTDIIPPVLLLKAPSVGQMLSDKHSQEHAAVATTTTTTTTTAASMSATATTRRQQRARHASLALDRDIVELEIKKISYQLDAKHRALASHVENQASSDVDKEQAVDVGDEIEKLKAEVFKLKQEVQQKDEEMKEVGEQLLFQQNLEHPLPVWEQEQYSTKGSDINTKGVDREKRDADCQCVVC
jgi:hypothetical protein